jgi:predicted ATPase
MSMQTISISLSTADTIFTYFQDKIGLTHYLFFVGGNNSGKSNNLTVLSFLAYRNMTSSDMTSANIYQFLGSGEEGIGTICED